MFAGYFAQATLASGKSLVKVLQQSKDALYE
jgi:hypothetical protein